MTPYDFVTLLARELGQRAKQHVYSGHTRSGALLVRTGKRQRVMIKPWNRSTPVGIPKLRETMAKYQSYKSHPVDRWVFVAGELRQSAVRLAESGRDFALVQVDADANDINVLASRNIPRPLLADLLEVMQAHSVPVAYDFDGTVRQVGQRKAQVEPVSRAPGPPRAFISYSHDSDAHKDWVVRLAAELMRRGVQVLLDEWDLRDFANDLNRFMETGIRESEFVLMVCTENYAERSDGRTGGVGIESTIITAGFYESRSGKYIPLYRSSTGDISSCMPSFLKGKLGVDFSEDASYDQAFDLLLRRIYDIPRYKRPELGERPDLESTEV